MLRKPVGIAALGDDLLVADHDATPADGVTHRLRILPVD